MQSLSRQAARARGALRPVAAAAAAESSCHGATSRSVRGFHATAATQADDTMEVFVNGESTIIPKGSTVLQACDAQGIDIPRWVSRSAIGRWVEGGQHLPTCLGDVVAEHARAHEL